MNEDRFEKLKAIVRKHKEAVGEWAEALREIKASGNWKKEAPNWEIWCLENAGVTATALRMQEYRERKKLPAASDADKKEERNALPSKTNALEISGEEKPIEVSAKVDQQAGPAQMHKSAVPPFQTAPLVKQDANSHLEELIRSLDKLSRFPLSSELVRLVQHSLCEAKKVQLLLQPALPLEVESSKKRSKGTREEVIQYCVLVKLTREDGEWFYEKNVGSGWKVNGRPINDWQATINAWKIQMIFPSQKQQSTYGSKTYRGGPAPNSRNEGTTPRPETQPDYGEAARRKQELQRANASRH